MRFVVTGGAGAIGSMLVRALLVRPDCTEVYVVDDLSSGYRWLLPEDDRITFDHANIVHDRVDLRSGDTVFHLAAHFANANSVEHPLEDLETNGMGTLGLLQQAEEVHVRRFVFAGAACAQGRTDTPYQIHKALGETYCHYFNRRGGVPTEVFKFHNSYGPGELPGPYRNVIPRWIWAALHDKPLIMYGVGVDMRDFVFVDDLVKVLVTGGPLTALGSGQRTCVRDLAALVLELTASKSEIRQQAPRSWDHCGSEVTPPLTKFPTSLRPGLEKTIAWFRENYDRIEESLKERKIDG